MAQIAAQVQNIDAPERREGALRKAVWHGHGRAVIDEQDRGGIGAPGQGGVQISQQQLGGFPIVEHRDEDDHFSQVSHARRECPVKAK